MIEPPENVIFRDKTPLKLAEELAFQYAKTVDAKAKKASGQYFTDGIVATFMAKFSSLALNNNVSILDPGCGTSILSIALIQEIVSKNASLKEITLTVYETDDEIIPYTKECLSYLNKWLKSKNIAFKQNIIIEDFVLAHQKILTSISACAGEFKIENHFDIIIANPPYFKISKNDEKAKIGQTFMKGQANIYALFMAVSVKLLRKGGEFIFITPRSYTSGKYFATLRQLILDNLCLSRIHLFGSRTEIFYTDKIQQES